MGETPSKHLVNDVGDCVDHCPECGPMCPLCRDNSKTCACRAALFYVQDSRQFAGNCALWWCPEGKGYTCEIDKAGLFTAKQCADMRDTDRPWPREVVEAVVVRHVDVQRLPARDTLRAALAPIKKATHV